MKLDDSCKIQGIMDMSGIFFDGYFFDGYFSVIDPEAICPITHKKYKDKRNKQEWGYSYDEFMQWQAKDFNFKGYGEHKEVHGLYSDRLFQWSLDKYNQCCQTVFGNQGQYWGQRSAKQIEQFLQLYLSPVVEGLPQTNQRPNLKLVYVIEGCNPGSGYPYWVFGYTEAV